MFWGDISELERKKYLFVAWQDILWLQYRSY